MSPKRSPYSIIEKFKSNKLTDSNGKNSVMTYGNRLLKNVISSTDQQTECVKNQLPVATDDDDIAQDVKPWWIPKKTISPTTMIVNGDPRMLKTVSPVSDVLQTESKLIIDERINTNK